MEDIKITEEMVLNFLVHTGRIFREFEETCHSQLTSGQYAVVSYLCLKGSTPINQVVCAVNTTKQQMTKLLHSLEDKNLVVRQFGVNPDKRVVQVDLTEKGRGYMEQSTAAFLEFINKYVESLSARDRKAVMRIFTLISEHN